MALFQTGSVNAAAAITAGGSILADGGITVGAGKTATGSSGFIDHTYLDWVGVNTHAQIDAIIPTLNKVYTTTAAGNWYSGSTSLGAATANFTTCKGVDGFASIYLPAFSGTIVTPSAQFSWQNTSPITGSPSNQSYVPKVTASNNAGKAVFINLTGAPSVVQCFLIAWYYTGSNTAPSYVTWWFGSAPSVVGWYFNLYLADPSTMNTAFLPAGSLTVYPMTHWYITQIS